MGDTNCVPCVPLVPPVAPSATNSNTKCTGRRIIQSSMDDSKFSTQVNYSYNTYGTCLVVQPWFLNVF